MGYRIHTTTPKSVRPFYVRHPENFFEDDEMAVGSALVFDDDGNQEAFVIVGPVAKVRDFLVAAMACLPVELTDAEAKYLEHIGELYEYDVDAGTLGREVDGWAWFLSGEDSTSYDLTNQQPRSLS